MGGQPARSAGGPPLLALIRTIPHKVTPCYPLTTFHQMASIVPASLVGFRLSISSVRLKRSDAVRICGRLPLRSATRIHGVGTCTVVWCVTSSMTPSAIRPHSRMVSVGCVSLRTTREVMAYIITGLSEDVCLWLALESERLRRDSGTSLLLGMKTDAFAKWTMELRDTSLSISRRGPGWLAFARGQI